MVFDGCPPELGGTILLRGEKKETLAKANVKQQLLAWLYWETKFTCKYFWFVFGYIKRIT